MHIVWVYIYHKCACVHGGRVYHMQKCVLTVYTIGSLFGGAYTSNQSVAGVSTSSVHMTGAYCECLITVQSARICSVMIYYQ